MAHIEIRTLACDGCGRDDSNERPVLTHELVIDGMTATREACGKCWNKALAGLAAVFGDAFDPARAPGEIVCLDCRPARSFASRGGLGSHRARMHADAQASG